MKNAPFAIHTVRERASRPKSNRFTPFVHSLLDHFIRFYTLPGMAFASYLSATIGGVHDKPGSVQKAR